MSKRKSDTVEDLMLKKKKLEEAAAAAARESKELEEKIKQAKIDAASDATLAAAAAKAPTAQAIARELYDNTGGFMVILCGLEEHGPFTDETEVVLREVVLKVTPELVKSRTDKANPSAEEKRAALEKIMLNPFSVMNAVCKEELTDLHENAKEVAEVRVFVLYTLWFKYASLFCELGLHVHL